MDPHANKGSGIRHIQQALGITRDQTMVFGDFLNDLEMMDEATYSFAMANAHPELAARARFRAPGNTDNGVVRTIKSVLGLGVTGIVNARFTPAPPWLTGTLQTVADRIRPRTHDLAACLDRAAAGRGHGRRVRRRAGRADPPAPRSGPGPTDRSSSWSTAWAGRSSPRTSGPCRWASCVPGTSSRGSTCAGWATPPSTAGCSTTAADRRTCARCCAPSPTSREPTAWRSSASPSAGTSPSSSSASRSTGCPSARGWPCPPRLTSASASSTSAGACSACTRSSWSAG